MRYVISQKLLAIGDDFSIKDEHGREIMYIDGKAMSLGKKLLVLDQSKKQIATIRQKLGTLNPTYRILREGKQPITIKKVRFSFRDKFIVDVPGPNDYEIIGDFLGHEYTFQRDGKLIARVSKKFISGTDTYGVDIRGDGDVGTILCSVIVVDLVLYSKRKS